MLKRKLSTFFHQPNDVKLLFARAIITSAIVKSALVFIPFSKIKHVLGNPNIESKTECSEETAIYLRKVQTALRLCNKYTPWETECYTLALTGKILLKRKNIISTLYFGFRKNKKDEYEGHAWLRSGSVIISGNKNLPTYQIQSYFT